ncbi:potassium transporter Kup [Chryseobacterium formosense]|uniref:Probable potassium transport system protein Kup n=1 Tax=Chryseobacterium formosense TaxID=236814 RepID=A0A085Z925_9FLAO|nr:KUP/HAK/KT family potassium transporter [Chryseobacterium formosense]KFF00939.1 potassium transporter Kup [Chryseobacterium formosense]SFT39783.1 KUP system potassium uptake protein [Chryseobacterium formosense]
MKTDTKQKVTLASLVVALGIIYGDIGTSPLYTFKAIIGERNISEILVLGGVSCIFWTLVLQTSVKYVWLTLKADNQGEGGIFSLYSLVRRYGRKIVIPTMIGAAALLADGIITPAVSVTSAIEGLGIIKGVEHVPVVPIVIAVISLIFFLQRFGTQNVGRAFGPIMMVWFTVLLVLGLSQIVHYPSVIKALNPYYAYELLSQYPKGFWLLGAVFLCTTGAEALYSDLGHCGRENIRITWGFVKVCLIVNYLGQASWLLYQGNPLLEGRNPFFEMMPSWFLIPGVIISTLAAIVASQALISGSFTLINEAISLNFWQRVAIKQPTETKGQIYIPSVNNILWAGCLLVVLYFQTSSRMEAAYGLAITLAMMMTTFLLSFFLVYKLKWNKIFVFLLLSVFIIIEISFFIANLVKFQEGGYITVFVGGIFFMVMYISYFGRKINNRYTKFTDLGKFANQIVELSHDETIPKYTTHLIYLTKADRRDQIEEKIINSIFDKKPKRADVYWFFHINRTNHPYTLDYEVSELVDDKVIKIVLNIGFRIQPKTELYFEKIIDDLIANKELNLHLRNNGSTKYNPTIDFKFILIEKFLSVENEFALKEGVILNSYFFLKNYAQKDEDAFGLDRNDVLVEYVPVVYQPIQVLNLERKA